MRFRHEPVSQAPGEILRHYLGDVIYGANDGIVTTFTVVSGVAGATLPASVVLILGFVNLLADGFSMGASNFLSIRSTAAVEGKDRGIAEPLLHAASTLLAFVGAGTVPLLSYLLPVARDHAFLVSSVATGLALFAVGASRCVVTTRRWFRSGAEMLVVGAIAAGVAFLAGSILGRWFR